MPTSTTLRPLKSASVVSFSGPLSPGSKRFAAGTRSPTERVIKVSYWTGLSGSRSGNFDGLLDRLAASDGDEAELLPFEVGIARPTGEREPITGYSVNPFD